jgi:hypothetical protein
MSLKLDPQPSKLIKVIKKTILAVIIGLGFFFGGVFCAIISPFVAILSLLYTPTITVSQKIKSWEDTFKDIQDPDHKEKWKKDHDNLYNKEDNPEEGT